MLKGLMAGILLRVTPVGQSSYYHLRVFTLSFRMAIAGANPMVFTGLIITLKPVCGYLVFPHQE
jgi:hypothetical protein